MALSNLFKKFGLNKNFLLGLALAVISSLVFIKDFSNYLMQNNYLGKLYIITLIILWTCINKFLGIIYVLIIVFFLMFNTGNYIENFETNVDSDNKKEKKMIDKTEPAKINVVTSTTEKTINVDNVDNIDNVDNVDMEKDKSNIQPFSDEKPINNTKSSETKNMALEGFDLQSTENAIKRGKQSNSIPVDQLVTQSKNDTISPYENNEFSEGFSIL